jgi:hypothetical protein
MALWLPTTLHKIYNVLYGIKGVPKCIDSTATLSFEEWSDQDSNLGIQRRQQAHDFIHCASLTAPWD